MIKVGLLTETQKDELVGQQYMPDNYFHVIQDINNNWIISQQQIDYCINPDYLWVKDLPLIEYQPKPIPFEE